MIENVVPTITGVGGAVLGAVLGAYLKYKFDRRIKREFDVSVEITILNDRTHLYKKTAEVLRVTKRSFLDTTWGPIGGILNGPQAAARDEYLAERNRARERGVECREIFAGKGREDRVGLARKECQKGNLLIKVVDPEMELPYMPDIVVADTEHVIISNVGAPLPGKYRYVYVKSEGLAHIFNDWYGACWAKLPGAEIGKPHSATSLAHPDGPSSDTR